MKHKTTYSSVSRGLELLSRGIGSQNFHRPQRHFSRATFRYGYSHRCSLAILQASPKQPAKDCIPRLISRYQSTNAAATAPNETAIESPKVLINDMENQEILISITEDQAVRYPSFWLRDHCLCDQCSHPDTLQRQIDTFTIDPSVKAVKVENGPSGLEITWSDNHHMSHFPWEWLEQHSPFPTPITNTRHQRSRQWIHAPPSNDSKTYPSTSYDEIMSSSSDSGLRQFISQIHTYGLSFIPNTPPIPEATESLLNRITFIRPTHYGGFWDFTSEPSPIDTAYTNLGLPAHTDNTYFTDPAGLQLFHCLSHTDASGTKPGIGGESTFIDGFAAASYLYQHNPRLYHALSTVPIVFTANGSKSVGPFNNNTLYSVGNPVLSHHSTSSKQTPENLTQIRWNNCDRSPQTTFPNHASMRTWYAAAKEWSRILEMPDFEIEVKLKPGEPVIFDNWRVLHGRRAFEGKRRICGAYIGMDDFRARGRRIGVVM